MNNMKKIMPICCIFIMVSLAVYSQTTGPRRSALAILPFETVNPRSTNYADQVFESDTLFLETRLVNELVSWDALNILTTEENSEYVVRGKLERVNNQFILSATVYETRTNRVMNTAREQGSTITALSSQMFSFAAQVTENVPFPNYLQGRWKAQINMNDGPLTCIMDFRSDRTIRVEQFDTWEHRGGIYALRYQGFGTGTYSFWGHARRMVRGIPVDGFVTVNLRLDDALPKYTAVTYTRINYHFNDDKTVFELVGAGFGCGDNYSGTSVYPMQNVAYITFEKIQ